MNTGAVFMPREQLITDTRDPRLSREYDSTEHDTPDTGQRSHRKACRPLFNTHAPPGPGRPGRGFSNFKNQNTVTAVAASQ